MRFTRFSRYLAPFMVALLTLSLVPSASAQEGTTFTVLAGGFSDEQSFVSVNAMMPETVTINVGDTISWQFGGFHTVTFPAVGGTPEPYIIADPNDASRMILNPAVGFPAGGATYDGTQLTGSGTPSEDPSAPPMSYALTFTAPGSFFYFCAVHPGQVGTVVVQESGALPMTPEEVLAAGEVENAAQIEAVIAREAEAEAAGQQPVLNGIPVGLAEALHYAPRSITIAEGETVTWKLTGITEPHTVTFVSPEEAPEFILVEENEAGPPTLIINPEAAMPAGGPTYDGTGFTSSGLMAPYSTAPGAPPNDTYALTFTKAGTYTYWCMVHGPLQSGTVTVTAAAQVPIPQIP